MKCWKPQKNDGTAAGSNNGPARQHLSHQQQQQQCTPVQAWQHGSLTLGFSGGGFLLPYHLGVYHSLAKMQIVSEATPMAGSSAGSLVSGCVTRRRGCPMDTPPHPSLLLLLL